MTTIECNIQAQPLGLFWGLEFFAAIGGINPSYYQSSLTTLPSVPFPSAYNLLSVTIASHQFLVLFFKQF